MLRLLLPAFAIAGALVVLIAGAIGEFPGADALVNALPFARGGSDRDVLRHRPESRLPEANSSQPDPQATQQPAVPDSLQRQMESLQQQAAALQKLAQNSQDLAQDLDQRTQELDRRTREPQPAPEADQPKQGAGPGPQPQPNQAAEVRQQLATRSELEQRNQQPDQRGRDAQAAQAEADRLHKVIEALRQQSRTAEAASARQKTEEAPLARQNAKPQQLAAAVPPPASTPPTPTRPATGRADAALPAQQLMTARQWLAAGRPDEARRLLAMAQTQLVLQPVTPDAPEARGVSTPAADVGNAMRWLDVGANGQAMQAINRAIEDIDGPTGRVRAWSGYSQPNDRGSFGQVDER